MSEHPKTRRFKVTVVHEVDIPIDTWRWPICIHLDKVLDLNQAVSLEMVALEP